MNELLDTITDTPQIHEAFRVWITTEEHAGFPISLLQASIVPLINVFFLHYLFHMADYL